MNKRPVKKSAFLSLVCLTALFLTACGGVTGATIQMYNEKIPALSVPEQLTVILSHKDMWMKEETRRDVDSEDDVEDYSEGPFYFLMDLDQDGYLECVVSKETKKPCPSFYEVTEDKSLKQWTTEGDLPLRESKGIFDFAHTGKTRCFYDSVHDQYHYVIMEYLDLCQGKADALYYEMTPAGDCVTFEKIGRYEWDEFKDNEHHYFNGKGKECSETELYDKYSDMTRKTIYYDLQMFSLDEGNKLTTDDLNSLWNKFMIRDDYRCEKESDITEKIEFELWSLMWQREDFADRTWEQSDTIRYTATDLNRNKHIEIIIENQTKNDYCIYEESDVERHHWKTEGKTLAEVTKNAGNIEWQTCTLGEFLKQNDDFVEDMLRECWLKFSS